MSEVHRLSAGEWRDLATRSGAKATRPDPSSLDEVTRSDADLTADALIDAHLPLADLVGTLATEATGRHVAVARLLGAPARPPTFIVGVTGGVAAGKTVTAEVLRSLLTAAGERQVDVVSTDGFLFPNDELAARGILDRKGFPESYDHAALIDFLAAVKAGSGPVRAPVYDHATYDVVADRVRMIDRPDILVVEGVNVLQPAPAAGTSRLLVSDFLDFSIYVDADEPDIRAWFLRRMQELRGRSTEDPTSFYAQFAGFGDDDFRTMGEAVWEAVNQPNLEGHILPTRPRADLVIEKAADHSIRRVVVRRG